MSGKTLFEQITGFADCGAAAVTRWN